VTSVLIGASSPEQIIENAKGLAKLKFKKAELDAIEKILGK
jgi:aryl-alcohol dehydrogenase-like predicted oxidoreductase